MKSLSSLFYFIESVMILVGIIIGAGVFVLPYTAYISGLIPTFFWLIISLFLITYLHLAFGEIILKTKEEYRLIGYTDYYLGKKAKILISLTTFLTFSFTLLVYLLLGAQFLNNIFSSIFHASFSTFYVFLILWFSLNMITLFPDQKGVVSFNFFLSFFILLLFLLIILLYYPFFQFKNLNFVPVFESPFNYFLKLILPYGVIFFALNGLVGVPELIKNFKNKKISSEKIKKAIIIGTLIPAICYFSFILFINGFCGENVTKDAIGGLKPVIGEKIVILGSLIGFLAVATSYIIFALYLKNTFLKDFSLSPLLSTSLIFILPLLFYLLNLKNIVSLISFLGGLIGGMEGLMVLFIFKKMKSMNNNYYPYSLPYNNFIFIFFLVILIFGALCQTFLVPLIS